MSLRARRLVGCGTASRIQGHERGRSLHSCPARRRGRSSTVHRGGRGKACGRGARDAGGSMQHGADVTQAHGFAWTPLRVACQEGHEACARLLLEQGADVNHALDGVTPLYVACEGGHAACARLLLDRGAEVNRADDDGWSPLYVACMNGHEACAELLVAACADVDQADEDGQTPLHKACSEGQEACVRLLLKHGADHNARDWQAQTALDVAIERKRTRCVVVLVGHGARVDAVDLGRVEHSVEAAVAVGGNQFVKGARFNAMPRVELRAIMWRSPSLQRIAFGGGSVTRDEDGLAVRPAVQAGDWVRVLDTERDCEVTAVDGDDVELCGRDGTVPNGQLVFAGPCHLAWHEASAAEARGQSNIITQVLCRRGYVSVRVRALVANFL